MALEWATSFGNEGEQCAEFPLLCNRRLGPLAVTVLPIPLEAVRKYLRERLAGEKIAR